MENEHLESKIYEQFSNEDDHFPLGFWMSHMFIHRILSVWS